MNTNSNKRFLIVEDDPTIRLIHGDLLMEMMPHCDVFEAENGAHGLCLFFKNNPDIVFLDMMMPYMDGNSFLDVIEEGINREMFEKKPRVIVITAIEDVKQLISIGKRLAVEAVITKPATQKQLINILKTS